MQITIRLVCVIMVVVCMGGVAHAGTWRVEQNDTGDFTIIQDAVEVAADGDTILIGPGHYQDTHEYDPQGYSEIQVIASWNDGRELSFFGAGVDEVIVGPDSYSHDGPYGFFHENDADLIVQGISFSNCSKSISTQGGCDISECRFSDTRAGIHVYGSGGGNCLISECEFFRQQQRGGGAAFWSASQVSIENCYFEDEDIYLQEIPDFLIDGCVFVGRVGSLVSSSGSFENNLATIYSNKLLYINDGSVVLVENNVFSVFQDGPLNANLSISGVATQVDLRNNIFNGGTYCALQIMCCPTVFGEGNHFIKGDSSYTIIVQDWQNPLIGFVDLRNNYWGTDNPALVGHWILDGADDPNIAMEVQYLPISDEPLPTEQKTLGGVKALYR